MRVSVRLFAAYREAAGVGQIDVDLPTGATVQDAIDRVTMRHPLIGSGRRLVVARNLEYVGLDAPLADGRTVLVEPVGSLRPGGGLRRLVGFRQAHATDYCLVVVARRSLAASLVGEASDLFVPAENLDSLGDRLAKL